LNTRATGLLVEIVKKVGGNVYISGLGGRKYINEEKFLLNGIKLEYFEFKPFKYPQRWDGFEPYMSAIDLLFNVGSKSNNLFVGASGRSEADGRERKKSGGGEV